MKTKEEKQKKFVTEFEINGEKYGGYIYATTFSEAEDFVRQRKATEKSCRWSVFRTRRN